MTTEKAIAMPTSRDHVREDIESPDLQERNMEFNSSIRDARARANIAIYAFSSQGHS